MGLLDFVKDIGNKIFDREEDGGQAIATHIESNNPGIENLSVEVKDGVATLSGAAQSQEAREKAILMAGNVKGVEEVKAEGLETQGSSEEAAVNTVEVEYYTIKSGDTLSAISKQYYGDANKYNDIFEANREVIQDPDKIFVGQKIRIPAAQQQ